MAQLNISPPKFTEADLDDAKQRQRIMSYLYKLDEQLRYVLNNLDAENFTEEYQKTIETANDRMERTFRDGQAKVMSKVSQTAGEIRAEVNEIQVGGANYLLNSGTPVANSKYNIATYTIGGIKPVEGETYTLRVWGRLGDDRTGFVAHNTNAYVFLGNLVDNGDGTHSLTFKWNNKRADYPQYDVDVPESVRIYQRPSSGTTESTITRIKLEAGSKATDWTQHPEEFRAGTSVVMNKDQFKVRTPEFVVEVPDEEGSDEAMLTINRDGVSAQAIECPNVAPRYAGPKTLYVNPNASKDQIDGVTYFLSLTDVARVLNNRWVEGSITVNLVGDVGYETVTFRGIHGGTNIMLKGTSTSHARLHGTLNLYYNSVRIQVSYLDIDAAGGVVLAGRMQGAEFDHCIIRRLGSSGSGYGISAYGGAYCRIEACEVYDFLRGFRAYEGGVIVGYDNKGNCTVGVSEGQMHLRGTQPCASTTWTTAAGGGEVYTYNVTVDQGSKPTTPTVTTTTKSYTATAADTWAGSGWNVYNNNDDIYQGYTDALGEHRGCVWFNGSAIRTDVGSKSVKQATLTLYQVSGVGRNQPVRVSIEGITVEKGGSQPYGDPEYGVIGTTLGPGQATTFTIPTNAITHLVSGAIKGFMLRTGETASAKGDDNSANYARFTGSGTNAPVLTVTYA